ncbi:hypothetical protein M422DRAFT_238161 [Sphaerobolus stellatus SS14]|nr:hypothetical protein M422DRAFT_238161 [Sphaerobolus stellatus SS14]
MSFFTLKDSHGAIQLVVSSKQPGDVLESMRSIQPQSSVLIEGKVSERPAPSRRETSTGTIEVQVTRVLVLNPVQGQLPFDPSDEENMANEDIRLKYRFLDLRRDIMSRNIRKRSEVAHVIRNYFHSKDFVEVETPILLKSSPEGAREFFVPARSTTMPQFYALPQSPQQPKQLLICSGGIDKYYQLARCFRDEDGRKDRQPEFTQVDLEMAYVSWGDIAEQPSEKWRIGGQEIRNVIEGLMQRIWSTSEDEKEFTSLPDRFPVMTYNEAMSNYGSDKPDLRCPLQISSLDLAIHNDTKQRLSEEDTGFDYLVIKNNDIQFRAAAEIFSQLDEPGAEKIIITSDDQNQWFKASSLLQAHSVNSETVPAVEPGDVVWIGRRTATFTGGSTTLGRIRLGIAKQAEELGNYTPSTTPKFLWVTEFPLFTRGDNEKEFLARGRWSSTHHPFTAPMSQDLDAFWDGRIPEVRGQHYDLVLNGVEIGGGSVRIHDYIMQEHVFSKILQLTNDEKKTFAHLLHALQCGAPPHGGFALGFDRLMTILCGVQSIRDVIAFPKTAGGTDSLFKSPSSIEEDILAQYRLQAIQSQ